MTNRTAPADLAALAREVTDLLPAFEPAPDAPADGCNGCGVDLTDANRELPVPVDTLPDRVIGVLLTRQVDDCGLCTLASAIDQAIEDALTDGQTAGRTGG